MKRLVAVVLAVLLGSGCSVVDGIGTAGDRAADPAFFFTGDVPTYGRAVSSDDESALAYLRAMRRVDVCGLADQDALARIGELSSVATLYAFEECDFAVKLPGDPDRRFLAVTLDMSQPDQPQAFRAGDIAVYPTAPGSCDYLVPVPLSELPGAGALHQPDSPFLRVGILGTQNCDVTQKLAKALAQAVSSPKLPARDGAARYSVPLAERDPCEVLGVLGGRVEEWDVAQSGPYTCDFSMAERDGNPIALRISLQPKIVEVVRAGSQHRVGPDGHEILLDSTHCSATVFVGSAMQRRLVGGEFVEVPGIVVRPAVTVAGGFGDCAEAVDVAGLAAGVFG